MGEFSAEWLRLRESVDLRSRNKMVADALHAEFAAKRAIKVVDIGCGTGANLRATAPSLGPEQDWTLLDNDAALLDRARKALARWADTAAAAPDGLTLRKGDKTIMVRFQCANVAEDPGGALSGKADLVTASAFFDLVSPNFIATLVAATARQNAAFHTVLTYNGRQCWSPMTAVDEQMRQAFSVHQQRDKGFGPAAGSQATASLARAFGAAGYRVEVGDSPWRVGPGDGALMRQLNDGIAAAVIETGLVDMATVAAWRACRRTGAVVGHSDMLALPPRTEVGWPP